MKALISPNESFDLTWISDWIKKEEDEEVTWIPIYSEILDCQRVAEVEPDNKTFEVAPPLHWVDCPEDCKADEWYFKDGQVFIKPQDTPKPEEN
jgi:hypothetical protein